MLVAPLVDDGVRGHPVDLDGRHVEHQEKPGGLPLVGEGGTQTGVVGVGDSGAYQEVAHGVGLLGGQDGHGERQDGQEAG